MTPSSPLTMHARRALTNAEIYAARELGQRRMQQPLNRTAVQLETANGDLDGDAVVIGQQGQQLAVSGAASKQFGVHKTTVVTSSFDVFISVHAAALNSFGARNMWAHLAASMEVSS